MDENIRKKITEFLNDSSKKKVTITVPKDFEPRHVVNPFLLMYRKTVLFLQRWIIPSHFKNWLLRSAGLNIGNEVCIPHYIHFDPYFPELITIDQGTIIGGMTKLHAHELVKDKLVLGRIHVEERVLIAGLSNLYPGVTVQKKSITGMHSAIRKDVPRGSFVAGADKFIKKWSPEELERHFGKSDEDPTYHKRLKRDVKAFRKDPNQKKITVRYDGLRFNPGNEWYLARPMWRIYYNAIFVELARMAPASWLRKFLLRCMGAKIGSDVYIGKNVVFDHIYGDFTTVEDGAYIGDNCYMDGHSYTITETIFGRVRIGRKAKLDHDVHVFCGADVGAGATIQGVASVMKDVPPGETWSGVPAKKVE